MEIKIQVSDITLDTVVAKAMVWDEDSQELYPTGGEKTIADLVAEKLTWKLTEHIMRDDRYPRLRDKVTEICTELIREKLGAMVDEALTGEIHQTNTYGERIGRSLTFREVLVGEVKKAISQSSDSYNRNKGTVLENAVRSEVKKAVDVAVAEEVAKMDDLVRQQVAEGMTESAIAAVLANALKK